MTANKRFIGSSGGVYDQYNNNRFAWSEWEEIIQIMNNLNEKARERSKALSKLQKENDELKQENKQLQFRIIDMLDFIKENDGVTRQEMKEWWNNKLEFYYKFFK